jgi:hypothetical protein
MSRLLMILGALATSAGPLHAAVFCVGTAEGLQHALDIASLNGQNQTIKVRTGTYRSPDHGFTYWHAGPAKLDIEGGWDAGCTTQTKDAALTVIDGGDEHPLLNLFAEDSTSELTSSYAISISTMGSPRRVTRRSILKPKWVTLASRTAAFATISRFHRIRRSYNWSPMMAVTCISSTTSSPRTLRAFRPN